MKDKDIETLWSEMPRWVRGLVLASLCYLLILGIGFVFQKISDSYNPPPALGMIFLPFLLLAMEPLQPVGCIYYGIWCALGALFVQRFGEKKGLILLVAVMYGLGIAVLFYAFTHFSFTIL